MCRGKSSKQRDFNGPFDVYIKVKEKSVSSLFYAAIGEYFAHGGVSSSRTPSS